MQLIYFLYSMITFFTKQSNSLLDDNLLYLISNYFTKMTKYALNDKLRVGIALFVNLMFIGMCYVLILVCTCSSFIIFLCVCWYLLVLLDMWWYTWASKETSAMVFLKRFARFSQVGFMLCTLTLLFNVLWYLLMFIDSSWYACTSFFPKWLTFQFNDQVLYNLI